MLRAEGYRVVLVNSNPATIMTDPATADATYVEPLDADVLIDIIEHERPDALLPTLGGQTALNLTMELVRRGELRTPWGRSDWGAARSDRHRRRPRAVQRCHGRDRSRGARVGLRAPRR